MSSSRRRESSSIVRIRDEEAAGEQARDGASRRRDRGVHFSAARGWALFEAPLARRDGEVASTTRAGVLPSRCPRTRAGLPATTTPRRDLSLLDDAAGRDDGALTDSRAGEHGHATREPHVAMAAMTTAAPRRLTFRQDLPARVSAMIQYGPMLTR